MSKHRYGQKAKKNPRRVAAGRKAWRTRVRRYGSKKAAIAATFGKRGKHRSAVAGRRAEPKAGGRTYRRFGVATRAMTAKQVLARIQASNGTTGLPPLPAEIELARKIIERARAAAARSRFAAPASSEARVRAAAAEKVSKLKKAEASRLVALKLSREKAEKAKAEQEAARKAAEAEIEAEMRRMG